MNEEPPYVEITATNFQAEAVDKSRSLPVLVDFWATWCGPCKTLGPILERVAADLAGRMVLAKVDIDKNPELAEALRIQSVPSCLLLVDGKLRDGFVGALPEKEVRAFLEPYLAPAGDDPLQLARTLSAEGRFDEALALLADQDDPQALLLRATVQLAAGRTEEASATFAALPDYERDSEEGRALRAQLDFKDAAGDLHELEASLAATPDDVALRVEYGKALIAASRNEEGLEALLEAARTDLHFEDDTPRKALVEAFELLGWQDPLTLEYQRRLSHLLCS